MNRKPSALRAHAAQILSFAASTVSPESESTYDRIVAWTVSRVGIQVATRRVAALLVDTRSRVDIPGTQAGSQASRRLLFGTRDGSTLDLAIQHRYRARALAVVGHVLATANGSPTK